MNVRVRIQWIKSFTRALPYNVSKNTSLILELYDTNMYKTHKRNIQNIWYEKLLRHCQDWWDLVMTDILQWPFSLAHFLLFMLNYCTKFILCNTNYCFTVKPQHFFIFVKMQASVYINPVPSNMSYAIQVHLQFPLLLFHIVKIYFFFFCCRSFFFSSRLRSFSFKFL